MPTHLKPKPNGAQPPPADNNAIKTKQPKADPAWKPEPCGLTREELRVIVAELLG